MKKLLVLIAALFIVTVGYSQSIVNRAGPANTVTDQRLQAKLNLLIPRYADTATANLTSAQNNIGIDSSGAVIYTYDVKGYWIRQHSPKKWVRIADENSIGFGLIYDSTCNCFVIDTATLNNYYINNGNATTNVTILNDSTIIICNGNNVCDTLSITTEINNLSSVSFLDGNTIVVCAADTTTGEIECDTLDIPDQILYVFQNGLNSPSLGIVEFGGRLIHDTELHTMYFKQIFAGLTVYDYPYQFEQREYFPNGTGIASFKNNGDYNSDGSLNPITIRLGINYTGDVYSYSPDTIAGYFGDEAGYFINTNGTGYGSFGLRQDDTTAKTTGIFFNTKDTATTNGVTLFAVPRVVSSGNNIMGGTGNLGDYKVLTAHTDKTVQIQGYPNTRNDGLTQRALYTDEDGNIKLGTVAGGGSTVTIFNDTTIIICSYGEYLCDTIITTVTAQTVFIANDSTLVVCAADGFTCDTLSISSGGQSFDRGFFEPDQISLGDTYHHANLNDFTLDFADTVMIRSTEETAVKSHLLMDEEFAQLLSETADHKMSITTQGLGKGTTVDIVAIGKAGNTGGWLEVGATVGTTIGNTSDATAYDEYLPNIRVTSGFIQINKVGADDTADSLYSKDATGNVVLRAASSLIGSVSANNGLTENTTNNIQLGGTLTEAITTITAGNNVFIGTTSTYTTGGIASAFTFSNTLATGDLTVGVLGTVSSTNSSAAGVAGSSTTAAAGVYGTSSATGAGVIGISNSGLGGDFRSTSGTALNTRSNSGLGGNISVFPTSIDTEVEILRVTRNSSGTGATGIGGSISFHHETTVNTAKEANKIVSKWVDGTDATRTSEMRFTGVNSATTVDILTLGSTGYMKLNPITAAAASAITAANGQIVYVSDTDATFTSVGFWARENGAWVKM